MYAIRHKNSIFQITTYSNFTKVINDLWQNFKLSFFELENITSPILQADIFANIQKKGQNRHCSPPFPCLTNSVSKNCQGRPNHFDILFASLEKEYHDVLSHELYEFFPRINIKWFTRTQITPQIEI